ncbi:hypothetical protein ECC02_012964 [Trypanosoma cruzi]|uniref:Uncharacterized protein n=1 Tax=Trypanosoma cruzi TaxID=5693 RepID=A0A7J6XJ36_TRYCR|nr:hypothetical protein ECC02_012964 [Trypanosoma cruzi]
MCVRTSFIFHGVICVLLLPSALSSARECGPQSTVTRVCMGTERSTQTRRESRPSIGRVSAAKEKKSSGGREMLTGLPAREMNTKTKKEKKNTAAGCGCVCGAAGVCPPWPQKRKQNKRERNVCSAPQALVARPHVTAPSARRSSRPLLMRAAGEAHRAVVMSVSVGVRVEQLGGKHTAPLAGRVQKKQLKEGRIKKKEKTSIVIAPKSKKKEKRGMGE